MTILKYIFIIIPMISFSQSDDIINHLTFFEKIESVDLKTYNKKDFSRIFLYNNKPIGIIGKNYQRIHIRFISIKKNINNKNEYIVYGKSKVKNNICDFKGKINIKKILKIKELTYGVDDYYKEEVKEQGFIIADYTFEENKHKRGTGIFKGKLYSKWCIFNKTKDKVSYDNIEGNSDSYNNNTFIGKWKSYKTKREKVCNWGDFRVPLAKPNFDIGAGEFSPNDTFLPFGWDNYRKAVFEQDKKAQQIENEKWWKK